MKLITFLILACLSVYLVAVSADAATTMYSSNVYAEAYDAISSGVSNSYTGSAIPTHTTLDRVNGEAYSKNAIDWYVSAGQTILSLGTNHQRTGTQFSYASSYAILSFTSDSNEPYELTGSYNVADVGANGEVNVNVKLIDLTLNTNLFFNVQYSKSTQNEQFVLGNSGGDFSNTLVGGLTGNLIAGHNYQLNAYGQIQAYAGTDSGASAFGNFTLKIGTVAVPEPASLPTLGVALAATLVVHRRKRS
jgi:hypothetical protein